jgi:glycerophosphoryl diester phosphodiesterase
MNDENYFRRSKGAPPYVFGHRGVRGAAPENTMAAFELAAQLGADGIELDVRLCRSGELVVCHDPDLSRCSGARDTRKVAELDAAELARVDVGGGQPVPLLTEVLAWALGRGLRVNVEMKRDVPDRRAVARETALVLDATPVPPVIVSSFDPWMLAYLSWLRPSLLLAYLVGSDRRLTRSGWIARMLQVSAVHPERSAIDAERCRVWQNRRLLVNVWTVNDAAEARALAEMGVDALITDVPGIIGDIVRRC